VNWSREEGYSNTTLKLIEQPTEVKRKVICLTSDEVYRLFNFKDFEYGSPKHHLYTTTYIIEKSKTVKDIIRTNFEVYRDMLVFGCGVGTRYSDLVNLKIDNYRGSEGKYNQNELGYFQFRMIKSRESKEVVVPMNELTLQIYKKYSKNKSSNDFLFPRTRNGGPIWGEKINVNIKVIGQIVGLNRLVSRPIGDVQGKVVGDSDIRKPLYKFLTTHIMRRTFIRESLNNQIPDYVVKQFSGHSSSKVFETYFNPTEKEMGLGHKIFSSSQKSFIEKNSEIALESLLTLYENGVLTKEEYLVKLGKLL
jgi:integrase